MFNALIPVLYVRISPDRLSVTNVKSGERIAESPDLAIAGTPAKVIGRARKRVLRLHCRAEKS